LTLLGGLALAPHFDGRTYDLGAGLVGKVAAARRAEFLDSAPESTWSLDTGTGELPAKTVFAIPLMFRDQLLGCLGGASAIPLSERERSWLGQIADQMAIGLRSIQQLTQLKVLSAELSDRSRRIELQNLELAESSRLKSDFLSSMSHELRTPLNAIIGFSEVLKDGLLGELPAEQLDYTTEIYQAGKHLLSLINDILDLSKIEAGKMELDVEPVELGPLVQSSIAIVKGLATANGVELTTHLDPSVTTIEADARKVRQIVYNLLSNAVKFSPNGGNVDVEVIGRQSDVEIAVADTGIGISPEAQRKLFVAFEQLDAGVSRKFEGTGLGLATVKQLAELHGGQVGVSSAVGRGSRFWVRLPQSQAGRARSGSAPRANVAPRAATGTVLVVESDSRQADVIRQSLARIGLAAVIAADPVAVQELLQDQSFHALVLNLETCASEEGLSFLTKRGSDKTLSDLPLIALANSENEPMAVDLRAISVLPSPVEEHALIGALRSLGIGLGAGQSGPIVLVVDDDPKAVSYVCKVLEATGMTTARAYGGQEALDAIAGSTVHAVVLDLMMPDVSGFDVLLQLRADPATRDLPVVVLTAKSLTASETASLQKMASAVVRKSSWRGSRFADVVRDAIYRSDAPAISSQVKGDASTVKTPAAVAQESEAHILLLGDQDAEQELTRTYLQDAGYRVTVAATVEQAGEQLGETTPDVAIAHLTVMGGQGPNSVQLLRSHPRYSAVPIVVVSGTDDPDRAAASGANVVLPKPIQRTPFLHAIDRLLGQFTGLPRVLLVDDDLNVLRVLSKYFDGENFIVDRADGGQAALDLIERRRPDVVVLDLMMPDVTGFEVLASLRSNPATAELPVAVLTAMDLSKADRNTLELAQAVLQKNTTSNSDLLTEVRRLLGSSVTSPTGAG
jgi:signal transduction histidine kinase/CheY-like chemotaxis protein